MMRNSLVLAGFSAIVAIGLADFGCSSTSSNGGTGGKTTTSQGGATGSQGGATGSQGGATGSQGGATGSQGGATGQGGTTGQGGATGDAGGGLLICNPAPADKSGCQGTEATCTKNCGPNVADLNMGRPQKACACTGPATTTAPISPASWDCSNAGPCTWPPALAAVDCFHLPTTLANCPMDTADGGNALIRPNASNCTLPAGTTCGLTCGSTTAPAYQDSGGTGRMGYCVCVARTNGTPPRWQCASTAEWAPQ